MTYILYSLIIIYLYCMKYTLLITLLTLSLLINAQEVIKIKREDNRFLFHQIEKKSDTISATNYNQFFIKLPDSLRNVLQINIENGLFKSTNKNSNNYQLVFVRGIKYSHNKPDSIFNTLLEGSCVPSQKIKITIYNTLSQKTLLTNTLIVK